MLRDPKPIPVREIIRALEREAANTDTDPRWRAATALREMDGWDRRTLMCCVHPGPSEIHGLNPDSGDKNHGP